MGDRPQSLEWKEPHDKLGNGMRTTVVSRVIVSVCDLFVLLLQLMVQNVMRQGMDHWTRPCYSTFCFIPDASMKKTSPRLCSSSANSTELG